MRCASTSGSPSWPSTLRPKAFWGEVSERRQVVEVFTASAAGGAPFMPKGVLVAVMLMLR